MRSSPQNWIDRTVGYFSPQSQLRRVRARITSELVLRHYEGAATGRRTQGWRRSSGDANTVIAPSLLRLRDSARDLVRNNPYAESAVTTVGDQAVGWGLIAKPAVQNSKLLQLWNAWAGTTACDAEGRNNLYGLQKLVMMNVVEAGEVLVRRRMRRLDDGLPIPMQLQVLEADFLDNTRTQLLPNGGQIVHGVEFDAIGTRVAYWLYPTHPGSSVAGNGTSQLFAASKRIAASEILHIFKGKRPGQVRGPSWFAPVLLRFKDFDEYEDATLMKQKIAACLAVITTDIDGSATPLGTADDTQTPVVDALEPGAVLNIPSGKNIEVVQPPSVRDHNDYCNVTLRAIATGLGVTYEDLTGDYTDLPFSAARMSRLRHWARVEDWRWRLLVPQLCDPVWGWAMDAGRMAGLIQDAATPLAIWTAPPMPMLDPDKEGLAYQRNVRTGILTLSEAIRERGYDPAEVFAEMAADNTVLDRLGLKLDSDPRNMTQAGQAQSAGAGLGSSRDLDRFVDFLSRLPEEKAIDILRAMFSPEDRAAALEQVCSRDGGGAQ